MYYYELSVTVRLKEELYNDDMYSIISSFINKSMLKDETLKEKHEKNEYKYYTFSSLWPIEKGRVYKKERIYLFNIRSMDSLFLMKLKRVMLLSEEKRFQIISIQLKNYSQQFISSLTTLSPVLVTMPNKKYWIANDGLEEFIQRISKNAIRKYNSYYSKHIPEDTQFIQGIVQTNHKPIKIPYKTTTLIGNKFQILIEPEKLAQDLAFFMKAVGVGEKGSIGLGYVSSK